MEGKAAATRDRANDDVRGEADRRAAGARRGRAVEKADDQRRKRGRCERERRARRKEGKVSSDVGGRSTVRSTTQPAATRGATHHWRRAPTHVECAGAIPPSLEDLCVGGGVCGRLLRAQVERRRGQPSRRWSLGTHPFRPTWPWTRFRRGTICRASFWRGRRESGRGEGEEGSCG